MSTEITTAFVDQFSSSVFMLSQQKESRLASSVRNETQNAESAFWDRIGSVTAQKKVGRHSDTPQIDTPHSRRRVTLVDYEWADLIDESDKLRLLMDPAGPYAMAAVMALGRAMDDEIIEKAFGNAYGGQSGGTTVALGDTEKIAGFSAGGTSHENLNVETLRLAKRKLDEKEVDESIPRHAVVSANQLESLLGINEVASADYNSIKALVHGEIDTFMGFNFIRSERLPTLLTADTDAVFATGEVSGGSDTLAVGSRRCMFYAEDGLLLAKAADIKVEIEKRADKSFSTQVYASMGIGATRMEEDKFMEVICKEA